MAQADFIKNDPTPRAKLISAAIIPNPARLPIDFLSLGVMYLIVAAIAAPFVIGEAVDYFYQPLLLALVHALALGWITATLMGVMYRYVPSLTHRPIRHPRIALVQFILFVIGSSGMVIHFALGVWSGIWSAAIVVIASIILFAANMFGCLWRQVGRGIAETGLFLAICFLFVAASIGFMLALDKDWNFIGGSTITNLASHAHFAAIGWVTIAICAVSYRMLPAFLLPKRQLPRAIIWQLYALAAGVIGLGTTLILNAPGAAVWAVVTAASLTTYVLSIGRLVRTRRISIDWTVGHALAGITWLVIALVLGLVLMKIGAQSQTGSRIAAAYGAIGLVGWMGNFIIGMSYQLFPGLVAHRMSIAGWTPVTAVELSKPRPRFFVFSAFNGGLAALVPSLLVGSPLFSTLSTIAITVAAITYSCTTAWTLSFAYWQKGTANSAS